MRQFLYKVFGRQRKILFIFPNIFPNIFPKGINLFICPCFFIKITLIKINNSYLKYFLSFVLINIIIKKNSI